MNLMSDVQRIIHGFLDMNDFDHVVKIFDVSEKDVNFYFKSQDIVVESPKQWNHVETLLQKYQTTVGSITFTYQPSDKITCSSQRVYASFRWKGFGIIRMISFISNQQHCDLLNITLYVSSRWDFGVLSNMLQYPKNLQLCVIGPFPLYTRYGTILPMRLSKLKIQFTTPIDFDALEKIKFLTDDLEIKHLHET